MLLLLTYSLEERTCPHCCRVFLSALLCRKHHRERVCKRAQRPLCAHCDREFADMAALKEHRRSEHARLRCTFCDFVAATSGCLQLHKSRKHFNLFCKLCKARAGHVLLFCLNHLKCLLTGRDEDSKSFNRGPLWQKYFKTAEEKESHSASCSQTSPELAQCDQCEKVYSRKQVRKRRFGCKKNASGPNNSLFLQLKDQIPYLRPELSWKWNAAYSL